MKRTRRRHTGFLGWVVKSGLLQLLAIASCGDSFFPDGDGGGAGVHCDDDEFVCDDGSCGSKDDPCRRAEHPPLEAGVDASTSEPEPDAATTCSAMGFPRFSASWSALGDAVQPAARQLHAATVRDEAMVVYGGLGPTGPLDEHWAYSGSEKHWTSLGSASPGARAAHAMSSYSSDAILLFGGAGDQGLLGDTWIWSAAGWSTAGCDGAAAAGSCSAPSARTGHKLAYDPQRKSVVLFGGSTVLGIAGDTWEWVDGQWSSGCDQDTTTDAGVTLGCGPAPRYDHALAYNPALGGVILFGGTDGDTVFGDTWLWNGEYWRQLDVSNDGPGPRFAHVMATDTTSAVTLLFGGMDESDLLEPRLWGYVPAMQEWVRLPSIGVGPSARVFSTLAAQDTLGKELMLFGGFDNAPLSDTWLLSFAVLAEDQYCRCVEKCDEFCHGDSNAACQHACGDLELAATGTPPWLNCKAHLDAGSSLADGGMPTIVDASLAREQDASVQRVDASFPAQHPARSPSCVELLSCCELLPSLGKDDCLNIASRDDEPICKVAATTCSSRSFDSGASYDAECLRVVRCCTTVNPGLLMPCLDVAQSGRNCSAFLAGGFCPATE